MKVKNIFIIIFFIFVIVSYYSFDYFKENKIIIEEQNELLDGNNSTMNVYLTGEVNRTGVFNVPIYWSLGDLLNYVGIKDGANLTSLNLEVKLKENETYNIPGKDKDIIKKININTCSIEELKTIKGIGDVLAKKIIEYRQSNRFESIEDIKNVSGIGEAMYEKIKHFITV